MTNKEKAEMLKQTIEYLYCKEGRSKNYISRLLFINRHIIQDKINEWGLIPAEPTRHLKPSEKKFLNRNKYKIKSMLDNDTWLNEIAQELKIPRATLFNMIQSELMLKKSYDEFITRRETEESDICQDIQCPDLQGTWKPILGFKNYFVSEDGKIIDTSPSLYLNAKGVYGVTCPQYVRQIENEKTGLLYVKLKNDKQTKVLQVANIVAHTFVDGYDDLHTKVNHIDGNVHNNHVNNLEWAYTG